ncbi:hypothetical protein CONLIGDRAFT_649940 [Coniochaeta ligniaria NRRL 30616]|uniref:Uncharacterized protein n=1 Tax=Coniochaeta ligniaria NRRL 30616 TaxID=1408157 RepID=A0A1J7I647_9PEZI|nr:hypothetical protein CONLIGDRAFT_649940 [Coniochaeta ligniaria NRRL 30616]
MIGDAQLPRRYREMTSDCETKPENGRRSFAPFVPAGNSFSWQQSAYPYNPLNPPFNRETAFEDKPYYTGRLLFSRCGNKNIRVCQEPCYKSTSHNALAVWKTTSEDSYLVFLASLPCPDAFVLELPIIGQPGWRMKKTTA